MIITAYRLQLQHQPVLFWVWPALCWVQQGMHAVYRNLRYFVPNPSFAGKKGGRKAPWASTSSSCNTASQSLPVTAPPAAAVSGSSYATATTGPDSSSATVTAQLSYSTAASEAALASSEQSSNGSIAVTAPAAPNAGIPATGNSDTVVLVQVQAGGTEEEAPPAELELLKGINMHAEPGNLLALMGGSGGSLTLQMACCCWHCPYMLPQANICTYGS